VHKADDQHRQLLRARRERPCYRAAEHRNRAIGAPRLLQLLTTAYGTKCECRVAPVTTGLE
jgi:hypothetical protein